MEFPKFDFFNSFPDPEKFGEFGLGNRRSCGFSDNSYNIGYVLLPLWVVCMYPFR